MINNVLRVLLGNFRATNASPRPHSFTCTVSTAAPKVSHRHFETSDSWTLGISKHIELRYHLLCYLKKKKGGGGNGPGPKSGRSQKLDEQIIMADPPKFNK